MPATTITDPADPRLADFADLIAADAAGPQRQIVIGEGVNVVERIVRSGASVRAVAGVAAKLNALEDALAGTAAEVFEVDKWVLSDVVGFRVTRGVLASVQRPPASSAEHLLASGKRFVVLETINDFENIGSIFRNAAAFGIDAVLLDARCADPLYRRSVRVSMGHVFSVPFAILPEPWPESAALLRAHSIPLLGLTPRPEAEALSGVRCGEKWAVVLGAEGPGLTEQTLAACDRLVRIPMAAGVDSLNVATAGAVAFSHLTS